MSCRGIKAKPQELGALDLHNTPSLIVEQVENTPFIYFPTPKHHTHVYSHPTVAVNNAPPPYFPSLSLSLSPKYVSDHGFLGSWRSL